MTEIKENQEFELKNILSYRGKVCPNQMESLGKDMEAKINEVGAKRLNYPVTAIFGVEGEKIDVEILMQVDRKIEDIGEYIFKEKIKIVNAVMICYKGDPKGLQKSCDELNQYILEKRLQPITAGYNVTQKIDPINIDNTEINVYVGINPNIL